MIHEGQVIDVENHVIPINLTVNKHHEGEFTHEKLRLKHE